MSYGFYKVLHLMSIIGVFISLGALTLHVMAGGARKFPQRKWILITHGLGVVIALVAGFGLMARLGMMQNSWPLWIWGKVAIWVTLGFIVAFIPRFPKYAGPVWVFLILIAGTAAYLANFKPV